MKTLYFDCIAGASGDMILGALVDAGLSLEILHERLGALHLSDFELRARRVAKNAFSATKVDVLAHDDVPERHLDDIVHIVEASDLAPGIKAQAIAIFHKMGEAEAHIHGTSLENVHLHELGGVDTIVDVVGALVGLEALGIERVLASPVPLGRGFIHGAHGQIPLPAPATVSLLAGVPVVGSPLNVETVTPTGAALLATLAEDFGPLPPMTLEAVGYGAGTRDLPIPNVLRVFIGEAKDESPKQHHGHNHGHSHPHPHPHTHEHKHTHDHEHPHDHDHEHPHPHTHTHPHEHVHEQDHPHDHEHPHSHEHAHHQVGPSCLDVAELSVLETNIDDLNPEFYDYVMARLFEAGALDVFFAPIQMKKNRPATLLRILCRPDDVAALTGIVFAETSTLGIREHTVKRHALRREMGTVETQYGAVRVKIAHLPGGQTRSVPEYNHCRQLAEQHSVPLQKVYQAAAKNQR